MQDHSRAAGALSRRFGVQILGTAAAAFVVVIALANMRDEAAITVPAEQEQIRGIAAADLHREVVLPRPTAAVPAPAAGEVRPTATTQATRNVPSKPQPAAPVRAELAEPASPPGPPLPLAPPARAESDSFVVAAGRTSVAALRTSADFVTRTVPRAVVTSTRDALLKARDFGESVWDRLTP